MKLLKRSRQLRRAAMAVTAAVLLIAVSLVGLDDARAAHIELSRIEFDGDELRLRGSGATPDASIFVDDIAFPLTTADGVGDFRIRTGGFEPTASCLLTVSDGVDSTSVFLPGCTAAPPAPTNQSPLPNGGPNVTLHDSDNSGDELFTLDGSASSDSDGTIESYSWTGPGVPANGSGLGQPPATGIDVIVPVGTTQFTLSVTDDDLASNTHTITVTVDPAGNTRPTVNAGPDQFLTDSDGNGSESGVVLSGSASDPDVGGSIVSFEWTTPGGPVVHSGTGLPGDVPEMTLGIGIHPFTLTVVDNGGASASDQVVVSVSPTVAPVANAGPDQVFTDSDGDGFQLGVVLSGSASGTGVSYSWRSADGSVLGTNAVLNMDFPVGITSVTLIATSDSGRQGTDSATITVNPKGSALPVANAGGDQAASDGNNDGFADVTLDGSASSDSDSPVVSWFWNEGLNTLAFGETPPDIAPVTVSLSVGVHTVTLLIIDEVGGTSSDEITVTVGPNVAPVADAGAAIVVEDTEGDGELVTLDGSGSTDATDGFIVSYAWTDADGASLGTTEVVPDVEFAVGQNVVTLTVTDDGGLTDSANVIVSVTEPAPDPTGSINITRARLQNGNRLRVEGNGAEPGEPVSIDGRVRGTADGAGNFSIRIRGFDASPSCVVVVSDGINVQTANLNGC